MKNKSKSDLSTNSAAEDSNSAFHPQNDEKKDETVPQDILDFYKMIDNEEEMENRKKEITQLSFEVKQSKIEDFQKQCIQLDFPLMSEYDFRADTKNKDINIALKPSAKLRPYQVIFIKYFE